MPGGHFEGATHVNKILISLIALATATVANASITPVLVGSPTHTTGSSFAYTYNATLASDQGIVNGSYFTLYDFAGFTGFGAVPANWTATTQFLGKTPNKTLPDDSASILNVSFTYTGPNFNTNGTTEQNLGNFVVFSTSGVVVLSDFTSLGVLNKGPTKGTPVATIGSNAIGVAGAGAVPEPATWATMLVGMGLVGASMRRRKTTSVTA
jgi:hypothetical protein